MKKPKNPGTQQIEPTEQQPTDPGPTTGGMGSGAAQPGEPTLEEKLGVGTQNDATEDPKNTPRDRG